MGSSRRWAASSGSSCSSYSSSRQRYDEREGAATNARRSRQGFEHRSVEDEREVARRVLEDLESLYFDGSGDDDSGEEDEDDFDSSSEWGSETSSHSSSGERKAGGMTLEELTVALNAAIEYHRPATLRLTTPVQEADRKIGERLGHSFGKRHQRPRFRRQEEEASIASTPSGESSFEFFQDMLERKQREFYAMKTAPASEEEVTEDRPSQGYARSHNSVTSTREKQTTTLVRDQATETEEFFQYPRFDASFGVQTPLHSPPRSVCLRSTQSANELPVAIGPTLADLAASHRRRERDRQSSRPPLRPESSWSSSSSSVAPDQRALQSYSSKQSSAKSSSNSSSSSSFSSSGISSRASNKSSKSDRSSKSSRSCERSSQPESLMSRSSKSESQVNQIRKKLDEPQQLVLEPTTQLDAYQPTKATEIQIDRASPDSPRIPSSPALVNWELDLSNFVL